jgi:hypothetical protein
VVPPYYTLFSPSFLLIHLSVKTMMCILLFLWGKGIQKAWHNHKDKKKKKKKKKKEKAGDINGEAHGEFAPDLAFFLGYIISSTTSIMYAINP